jgi:arginase
MQPLLIGSASGWGAQIRETEFGPEAFKRFANGRLNGTWDSIIWSKISCAGNTDITTLDAVPFVYDHVDRLSKHTHKAIRHNQFPVVIGGDHACAIGTWSGIISALHAEGQFGLIWIDAHMDSHTLATSPSGAYHGMPIASLLGEGEKEFAELCTSKAKISPEHICLIGIRSYEEGEEALLKKLGVRVYKMDEIAERGFDAVYQEALKIVKTGTKGYGVSIDLDAFDPKDAPGVGSREKGGLRKTEVQPSFKNAISDSALKALEIAEFNPKRDKQDKTAVLIEEILASFFN